MRKKYLHELASLIPPSAIVTIFRNDMRLIARSRELKGFSPFNKEKTPSFFVVDDKNRFFCFSSGKSGTSLDYLVKAEGLPEQDAIACLESILGARPRTDKWVRQRPKRKRTRARGGTKRSPDFS